MADPRPVSAKIAYRLCATVLESAARRLEEKPARTLTRRPEVAATPGPDRRRGREAAAAELRRDAARLHHLAVLPAGAGADAAALGYLLAWLTDAGEMMSETGRARRRRVRLAHRHDPRLLLPASERQPDRRGSAFPAEQVAHGGHDHRIRRERRSGRELLRRRDRVARVGRQVVGQDRMSVKKSLGDVLAGFGFRVVGVESTMRLQFRSSGGGIFVDIIAARGPDERPVEFSADVMNNGVIVDYVEWEPDQWRVAELLHDILRGIFAR